MYTADRTEVNNIPAVIIETNKFKTITIQLQFRSRLERSRVTTRNILSRMMIKRTLQFRREADLLKHLAHYYGAHLTSNVGRKGEDHIVTLSMEFVNDRFIKENLDVAGEMCRLLRDVLETPSHYDDSYEEFFKKEKRLYKNRLKSMKDNRAQSSFQSMIDVMFEDEDYKYLSHGVLGDIDSITLEDIRAEHEQMMSGDDMAILVAGAVDEDIKQDLSTICSREAPVVIEHRPYPYRPVEKVKNAKDTQQIEQAKLNMGFRVDVRNLQEQMAFNVMNQMYGGSASSLLFRNIREKLSLAYQIHSQVDVRNGYLFVMGGIDPANVETAESAILAELDAIKNGAFEAEFVEEVKRMMRVNRQEIMDKPKGLITMEYNRLIQGVQDRSWEERLQAVDSDMIREISSRVVLDTVYVLTRSDEDEKN
ncbi:insulinase family protein [Salinicoccus sp. ID82-1]|uniref:EF-P 5-aminopentanol modification-associated protein YfmF n=1 Tax=Salinicoccus sp. ID82-1 TaxID=2820269 RepID=UPI001F3D2214|nr:insulinase family protein [Salinicoccus sp. ID82-1]MCG1008743.1 insulinase family protein [Salinicoccus sp. ID82-1]